jgi:transcription-repair coupling factor (superfamily II helicase)
MDKEMLLSAFAAQEPCRQLLAEITAGHGKTTLVRELSGSAKNLAIAASAAVSPLNLVVMYSRDEAMYCYGDLNALLPPEQVFFFPSSYKRGVKDGQTDTSNIVQRTAVLNAVIDKQQPLFIVTYPEALAEKVASRNEVEKSTIRLQKGEKINMAFLRETLLEYGFERVDFVTEPGQFALRGSLVDVFSFSDHRPVRVDFFGDEVESIRTYNVDTQ